MKASELIEQLKTEMKLKGDLPVHIPRIAETLDHVEIDGLATFHSVANTPTYFMICDPETLEELSR